MNKRDKIFLLILVMLFFLGSHGVNTVFNRVQVKSIWHVYGGFEDSSTTIAVTQGSWTTLTNAWENLWDGTETDGFTLSGDTMTVGFRGDITGMVSLSFAGSNTKIYNFRLYNITQARQAGFKMGMTGVGANEITISFPIYMETTKNDKYVLEVYGVDTAVDISAIHGQFYLAYLHDR